MKRNLFRRVLAVLAMMLSLSCGSTPTTEPAENSPAHNEEIAALFEQDQSDRRRTAGETIDWELVTARDRRREARALEIYTSGALRTAIDYYHAAVILQHSQSASSHLLAHELAIVAAIKGEERAKWLVAATEDRFLMNIGQPQRFGTQYRSDPREGPNAPIRLYEVDSAVTDDLRHQFNVPPLDTARRREAELNNR